MTEEGLNRAEVVAGLEKVRGKTVAKGVRGDSLREFGLSDCFVQRFLNMRVMKMIPPPLLRLCNEG
jgi:hypothetical protein